MQKYVRKGGKVDKMSALTFLSLLIYIFHKWNEVQ